MPILEADCGCHSCLIYKDVRYACKAKSGRALPKFTLERVLINVFSKC